MRFTHTRAAAAGIALTAAVALATPSLAQADPGPTVPSTITQKDIPVGAGIPDIDPATLEALGTFAPALIGSLATPGVDGKVNSALLDQVRAAAGQQGLPKQAEDILNQILTFISNPQARPSTTSQSQLAKGDPIIPTGPNKPKIQQFLYPTIGFNCTASGNAVITALAAAGPQKAPAPGPKAHQMAFVATALGTGPAVNNRSAKLYVSWLNLDNLRTGQTSLLRNDKINAVNGPGTFTGIAKTGGGRIIAALYGVVTTKINGKPKACGIAPTVGLSYVR